MNNNSEASCLSPTSPPSPSPSLSPSPLDSPCTSPSQARVPPPKRRAPLPPSTDTDTSAEVEALPRSKEKSKSKSKHNRASTASRPSTARTSATSNSLASYTPTVEDITRFSGNNRCMDCGAPRPDWISIDFGICICLSCSGFHRSMGVHVTNVRSLSLDTLTDANIKTMLAGGNDAFSEYLSTHNVRQGQTSENRFQDVYALPAVLFYREILKAVVAGTEIPEFDPESYRPELPYKRKSAVGVSASGHPAPPWVPDSHVTDCQLCNAAFTLFFRRHHCRRCGRCVCSNCAPSENVRPIPEWAMNQPVRHCRSCYKSPNLEWGI